MSATYFYFCGVCVTLNGVLSLVACMFVKRHPLQIHAALGVFALGIIILALGTLIEKRP